MPIVALPKSTVRAIGSTSVISDPCSVVKELLDNALDASASSVVIEISQNTVDLIQVKDNGHGIVPEDHALVCRRSFTSKIQTVDDLRNVGGNFLGFRGEALASAAEMSGSFTVTTRNDGQVVGSTLQYGRNGELISSQRAPHPVGTTIRITDFLKYIPVRRQTVLKSASKTLTRIKKMLQTYAMSQPSKRISFKVLKAKSESSNWVYAPGRNATLTDAALKVIGFEVASCCTLETKSSGTAQSGNGETSNYELIAFLPKANADFSKVGYAGQFFSVDGRPLSTTRGIGSDIVKLYKSYLRSAASRSGHPTTISDPFICLHIRCPTGSYDANVEPAKDDVLFEDPRTVLSLVEDLFRNIYGDLEGSTGRETLPKRREKLPNNDGFELLMARKRPAGPSPQIGNANNSFKPLTIATPRSQFRSPLSVSTPGENIREQRNVDLAETPHTEDDTSSKDLEFLNPWSITKINAPLCTPERSQPRVEGNHCLTLSNTRQAFRQRPGGSERRYQGHMRSPALPSPSDSNASSTSPTALYCTPLSAQSSQMSPTASIQNSRKRNSRDHDKERDGNGALDTWLQTITPGASGQIPVEEQSDNDQGEPSFSQRVQEQFSLHGKSLLDTPESTARESSALCEPLDDISQKRQSSASVQETEVEKRGQGLPGFKTLSTILHRFPDTDNSSQLEKALDFERRKKQAMRKRREHMRSISKGDQIVSSSPHRRRYLAARAALSSDLNARTESEDVATSEKVPSAHRLNPNDPRAYLMRNRSNLSKEGMQIKRIRTGKLPFETIPEGHDLYNVCLTQPADMTLFSTSSREMLELDLYTQCPTEYQGFSASEPEEDLESWKHRLSTLIKNKYGPPDEENLEIDISSALTRHLIDLKDCWN